MTTEGHRASIHFDEKITEGTVSSVYSASRPTNDWLNGHMPNVYEGDHTIKIRIIKYEGFLTAFQKQENCLERLEGSISEIKTQIAHFEGVKAYAEETLESTRERYKEALQTELQYKEDTTLMADCGYYIEDFQRNLQSTTPNYDRQVYNHFQVYHLGLNKGNLVRVIQNIERDIVKTKEKLIWLERQRTKLELRLNAATVRMGNLKMIISEEANRLGQLETRENALLLNGERIEQMNDKITTHLSSLSATKEKAVKALAKVKKQAAKDAATT